jgi:hypothetical protein
MPHGLVRLVWVNPDDLESHAIPMTQIIPHRLSFGSRRIRRMGGFDPSILGIPISERTC